MNMAYSKKLIHFATRANFDAQLAANNILGTSICFIKDAKQIWTHGQFYSCPFTEEEIEQLFVGSKIKLDGYVEMASPVNISETDTVNEAFGKIEEYLGTLDELNAILVDTGDVAEDPTFNDYISPGELSNTLEEYAKTSDIPTKVSLLVNNNSYATESYVNQSISTKLNIISDLDDIRAGASLGATALQSIPLATVSQDGLMTSIDKSKLNSIEDGALVNTVTGVKGDSEATYRTGNVNITAGNLGITVINNTADANKSVKYATSSGSCTGNSATATKATLDASGNNIVNTYATKSEVSTGLNGKINNNGTVTAIVAMTQAEYDVLGSNVSATTLYIITD